MKKILLKGLLVCTAAGALGGLSSCSNKMSEEKKKTLQFASLVCASYTGSSYAPKKLLSNVNLLEEEEKEGTYHVRFVITEYQYTFRMLFSADYKDDTLTYKIVNEMGRGAYSYELKFDGNDYEGSYNYVFNTTSSTTAASDPVEITGKLDFDNNEVYLSYVNGGRMVFDIKNGAVASGSEYTLNSKSEEILYLKETYGSKNGSYVAEFYNDYSEVVKKYNLERTLYGNGKIKTENLKYYITSNEYSTKLNENWSKSREYDKKGNLTYAYEDGYFPGYDGKTKFIYEYTYSSDNTAEITASVLKDGESEYSLLANITETRNDEGACTSIARKEDNKTLTTTYSYDKLWNCTVTYSIVSE